MINVIEWWQSNKTPGTFAIEIGISDKGITDESYQELSRIIDDVKPVSRHLSGLSLQLVTSGSTTIGVSSYDGNTLNIYPYITQAIHTTIKRHLGATIHCINTLNVYPYITDTISTSSKRQSSVAIHFIDTMRIKP